MQEPELTAPEPEEYFTAGDEAECRLKQEVLLRLGDALEFFGTQHPQPECSSGFCSPCDSPGPVPVTEEAAILSPKKVGRPCPSPHPCTLMYKGAETKKK
jgi:hypothetical protein